MESNTFLHWLEELDLHGVPEEVADVLLQSVSPDHPGVTLGQSF